MQTEQYFKILKIILVQGLFEIVQYNTQTQLFHKLHIQTYFFHLSNVDSKMSKMLS